LILFRGIFSTFKVPAPSLGVLSGGACKFNGLLSPLLVFSSSFLLSVTGIRVRSDYGEHRVNSSEALKWAALDDSCFFLSRMVLGQMIATRQRLFPSFRDVACSFLVTHLVSNQIGHPLFFFFLLRPATRRPFCVAQLIKGGRENPACGFADSPGSFRPGLALFSAGTRSPFCDGLFRDVASSYGSGILHSNKTSVSFLRIATNQPPCLLSGFPFFFGSRITFTWLLIDELCVYLFAFRTAGKR